MNDDPLHDLPEAERRLALKLRGELRQAEHVPPATAHRLARARAAALEAGAGPRMPAWLWASGGVVAASAVAVALFLQFAPGQPGRNGVGTPAAEAIEVLTDDADPELYEDLELYRWLAEEDGRA